MARVGAALSFLLFSAISSAVLVLPDATVTFWVSFENPNDALDYLEPILAKRGLIEIGQRHMRSDGVFSASFRSRSIALVDVAVNGHAAGENSHCTVVDFYVFAEGYGLQEHAKGSVRNEDAMAQAFEFASDIAVQLQASGAADVKVMPADENEGYAGSIGCLRHNKPLEPTR